MPALKRRIAPTVPITLELEDEDSQKFKKTFHLCFDFNAISLIEERTGFSLLDGLAIWGEVAPAATAEGKKKKGRKASRRASLLSIMFWASVAAKHPEYLTEDENQEPSGEGLQTIRSYMNSSNSEEILAALWEAYLLYLPADQRELLKKLTSDAEAQQRAASETSPLAPAPDQIPANQPTPAGSISGPSPATSSESATKTSAA